MIIYHINLLIAALTLGVTYGFFISTILISMIIHSGYYVTEKWINKPLSIVIFIIISLYTLFYYKFLFEAIKAQYYEKIGMYSAFFLPPVLIVMFLFIFTQLKYLNKLTKDKKGEDENENSIM